MRCILCVGRFVRTLAVSPMPIFPKPLRTGDIIAVTAPSSGVSGPAIARLDLVLNHLQSLGYRIVEGSCLRSEHKNASAPRDQRAQELMQFLTDPKISAILPPWGGELASELLELVDFEMLRSVQPKWLLGFSDLSTLQLPLTLRELGVPEFSDENLAELVDLAGSDPAIMFNPREASSDDLTQLLKRAY